MGLQVRFRPHRAAFAMVTAALLLGTTAALVADTRVYSHTATGYSLISRTKSDEMNAIVCNSAGCMTNVTCDACHAATTSQKPFTAAVQRAHFDRYYAKGEIILGEGASLKFGAMMLRRLRGVLYMVDPRSNKMQPFVTGARILKGKDGQPWIHYQGAAAPPFSR
jgi:cytochrome c5